MGVCSEAWDQDTHGDKEDHDSADRLQENDYMDGDDRADDLLEDEEHRPEHRIDIPPERRNQGGLPFQVQRRLQHP